MRRLKRSDAKTMNAELQDDDGKPRDQEMMLSNARDAERVD